MEPQLKQDPKCRIAAPRLEQSAPSQKDISVEMETQKLVPCNHCRKKHLKCNNKNPCTQCSKSKNDCVRVTKRYRFSKTKRLDASLGFSDDQTWIKTRNAKSLSFIDVGPQAAKGRKLVRQSREWEHDDDARTTQHDHRHSERATGSGDGGEWGEDNCMTEKGVLSSVREPSKGGAILCPNYEDLARHMSQNGKITTPTKPPASPPRELSTRSFSALPQTPYSNNALNLMRFPSHGWQQEVSSFNSPHTHVAYILPVDHYLTSPIDTALRSHAPSTALRGLPEGLTDDAYLQLQEACLMRHYVEALSPGVRLSQRELINIC